MSFRRTARESLLLLLVAWAGAAGITPRLAADGWTIRVEVAPFDSVTAAAEAESQISWADRRAPANVACTLAFAAVELRDHLESITPQHFRFAEPNESLPSASIFLLTQDQAKHHPRIHDPIAAMAKEAGPLPPGGFVLLPLNGSLAIVGMDRVGTLHGTYAFLESLGVRWYGPEDHEVHLPTLSQIELPVEPVVASPSFATRGFWVREDKGNKPFYRWMARNRMNYWSIAEPDRAFLQKLGMHLTFGGHHYWEKYLDPAAPFPAADPPPDRGTPLTFFEAKPEWYGLNEAGEREPFEGMYGMNVCSSNPEPMTFLYGKIIDELTHGEWQDVDSLNFWSIDNGVWCQCGPCSDLGEPTDRLMLMVHGLDQAIDQAIESGVLRRPIKIVFPIYQQTLPAPTRPLPTDFDYSTNIGTFFPILRCYVHSIDDPTCTEYNTDHWAAFQGWTQGADRHYRGEIFVGEYFNVSVNKSLPVIYPRVIQEDIPKYYRGGARHMHYMHTDTRLLGVKRINNFLFARMLCDATADLAPEIDAYFANLYGPVADEMQAIYDQLEFAHANIRQIRYWHHLPERIADREFPLFNKTHFQLEKTRSAMDDGIDLAESVATFQQLRAQLDDVLDREDLPAAIRQRLAIDDQTIRYGENTVLFYDAVARAVLAEAAGDLDRARAEYWRSLAFARALKAETEVVKTATNHHVHAHDGLHATRIEEAYLALGERLIPGTD